MDAPYPCVPLLRTPLSQQGECSASTCFSTVSTPELARVHSSHRCLWLWWPREIMLQGPCGSETIGERVLSRLPPPGHCTDKGLKHTPSLPMKKAHLLYLEFQPEGQASGYHTFRSYESALRECRPGLLLGLATVHCYILERSSYTHLEP